MKNKIKLLFAACTLAVCTNAQITTLGNIGTAPDYVGWSNINAFPLQIRHNANQEIHTYTNNLLRMKTAAGGTGNTDGRIGIGNNLPLGFSPQARIHLHQTGGFNNLRLTTDATGFTNNDGFVIGMGNTGDVSFINNELNANFTWINQGSGPGSLLSRMRLYDGGTGQNTGRLAISNDLPLVFNPIDRLHIYENANSGDNAIRFQNASTGLTATDGFQTGIDNILNIVHHRQFENRPIYWESPDARNTGNMTNWMTLQNGVSALGSSTDGFLGLNNDTPIFHIDMLTPEKANGELLLRARIETDLNAYIGFSNLSATGNTFSSTLIGVQSDNPAPALTTTASIDNLQDLSTNPIAVTRFISAKNYDPVTGVLSFSRINTVDNRKIYQWNNAYDELMTMEANGFLGVGTPSPENRVEINSDWYDPTGQPAGAWAGQSSATPNGQTGITGNSTGYSGLRFTDLTSSSIPETNLGIGVLSVDANGDVILVDTESKIGDYCSNAPVAPLPDDYFINMGDRNIFFNANAAGKVNFGFVNCAQGVDALVFMKNTVSNSGNGLWVESSEGSAGIFKGLDYGINAEGQYAVYGSSPILSGYYAGYFNGDVFTTGSYLPSDENLKTNIQDYDSSLYVINLLQPRTFEYDNTNFQGINLPEGHKYGLIAQEVELVIPALVKQQTHPVQYDSIGNQISPAYNFKGMDYEGLIPILLGGIKEQQSIITSQDSVINNLNDRLSSLENCLSGILPYLCQLSNTAIEQNDEATQDAIVKELAVELNNVQSIILGQNVPNPFAEQTVIEYSIPSAVQKAQFLFYDVKGQLINSVDIEEMGNGRLTVFGDDLSTGTYTYTLVADGQIIATKKMVKTN